MFPAVVVISHLWFDKLDWIVPLPFPLVGPFLAIALAATGSNFAAIVLLLGGTGIILSCLRHKDGRALLSFMQPAVDKIAALMPGSHVEAKPQLRHVERWFNETGAPLVIRGAKPLVIVFSITTVVVFFAYAIRMERATTLVRLWQPDCMFERYSDIVNEAWPKRESVAGRYGCEPDCQDVYFVFGVHAADNGDIFKRPAGQYENGDPGTLERDLSFSLTTESQCWLQHFTDAVRSQAPLISTMSSENQVAYNPTPLEEARLHGGCEWGDVFEACFIQWAREHKPPTVFFDGQTVVAVAFQFHSTLRGDEAGTWDYPVQKQNWEDLEAFMSTQLLTAPAGLKSGWHHSREFVLTDMQHWMYIACWESSGISIAVVREPRIFFLSLSLLKNILKFTYNFKKTLVHVQMYSEHYSRRSRGLMES